MRKFIKLTSIVLVLVSLLTLCSGCMKDEVMTTIVFGVPYAEDSTTYANLQLAVEDLNLFQEGNFVRVELRSIPEDEAGKKAFLEDVNRDKVGFFMYERDELITPYIESGKLATLATIQEKYPALFENKDEFVLDTSTDVDGVNHMLALKGSYQGVFYNEDIFIQNGLSVPKTWEQFQAVVNTLKTKGVTPIAGGFADTGLQYVIDELILMEGGVAEHSYVPKYGVVNSWSRAVNLFKSMKDTGFFNADCMTKTYEDAKQMFKKGQAAMIIGSSKDIAGDDADIEKLGVFALPVTQTGKKEIGDIICDYNIGVYINSQFLKKKTEIIDIMAIFMVEYLDVGKEELTSEDWSYENTYQSNWSMPSNKYVIHEEEILYDEEGNLIETTADPTALLAVTADENLHDRVFSMMEGVDSAGRTLANEYKTFDFFIEEIRKYITSGGDIEKILVDATAKEVEARGGTANQE